MTMYCVVYTTDTDYSGNGDVKTVYGVYAYLETAIDFANKKSKLVKGANEPMEWDEVEADKDTLQSNLHNQSIGYHNWKIFAVNGEHYA